MNREHWLFSIGPLDSSEATALREQLEQDLEKLQVDLVSHREWFAVAWDTSSVRRIVLAVQAGLESGGLSEDARNDASALLDDMETWLETESSPRRDPGEG